MKNENEEDEIELNLDNGLDLFKESHVSETTDMLGSTDMLGFDIAENMFDKESEEYKEKIFNTCQIYVADFCLNS